MNMYARNETPTIQLYKISKQTIPEHFQSSSVIYENQKTFI